jgi:hypothetical protein
MNNSSTIALTKNPVFHDRNKHIDIRFHHLKDCVTNKEIEVKYVKTWDQVVNIFIKPLKYDISIKIRDLQRVMKKSSLRGVLKIKLDF